MSGATVKKQRHVLMSVQMAGTGTGDCAPSTTKHQVSLKEFVTAGTGAGAGVSFIDLSYDNDEGGGAGEMEVEEEQQYYLSEASYCVNF